MKVPLKISKERRLNIRRPLIHVAEPQYLHPPNGPNSHGGCHVRSMLHCPDACVSYMGPNGRTEPKSVWAEPAHIDHLAEYVRRCTCAEGSGIPRCTLLRWERILVSFASFARCVLFASALTISPRAHWVQDS